MPQNPNSNILDATNEETKVKTDAKSTVLAAKRKDAEGNSYLEQIRFAASQNEENVVLAMEMVNSKTVNGKPEFQTVSKPGSERIVLATIKTLFNDHYSFGYILSNEYKNGGFVIDGMILPFLPALQVKQQNSQFFVIMK